MFQSLVCRIEYPSLSKNRIFAVNNFRYIRYALTNPTISKSHCRLPVLRITSIQNISEDYCIAIKTRKSVDICISFSSHNQAAIGFSYSSLPSSFPSSSQSKWLFALHISTRIIWIVGITDMASLNFKELLVSFRSLRFECTNEWIFLFEKLRKGKFQKFPEMHS
ncbi:hypothetical protein CLV96_1810 [Leptospira meyeri]|uniref:Uncharacterized protein n=1 Tax=Leptospira meyeri TaxID=29508 RepID=A0A4R8MTI5_LEPME|nr:hypothetical protein CLV96_1810 [Leptospira meyeri]